MSRLYRRGDTWWGYWRDAGGEGHRASLRTADKAIARDRLRQREAAPDRPAHGPALGAALTHLLEVVYAGRRQATVSCYTQKARHVERVLGEDTPITAITRADVLRYRATRLTECAAPGTIYKELVVLRLALRESGGPDVVPRTSAGYVPRTLHLTPSQAHALRLALPEHRRRWLMVALYVGPRASELDALRWDDVDGGMIHIRGTKTRASDRYVPIADELAPWIAEDGDGPMLPSWPNCNRDLRAACRRAGVPEVTANDLRRTFASWLKQAGVDSLTVARLMGHTSTRMVDAVYAQLTAETYRTAIGLMPACTPGVQPVVRDRANVANVVGRSGIGVLDEKVNDAAQVGVTAMAPTVGLEPTTRGLTVLRRIGHSPTGRRR